MLTKNLKELNKASNKKKAKKIIIKTNKGGGGKSILTTFLAHLLSTLGNKVLIVTTDSQNNVLHFMGKSHVEFNNGLESWIKNGTGDIIQLREDLYFIPLMCDYIKPTSGNKKKLQIFFEKQEEIYDYIFIDATPTLSLDEEFLNIADSIIIPTSCDNISTDSIYNLLQKIPDKSKIKAVVPNKFLNTKLEKDYYTQLKEIFDYHNIKITSPIPQLSCLGEIINKGKTPWEMRSKKFDKIKEILIQIAEVIL